MHAGLVKQSPGKKQPVIHKNITSNDFQFLSKVYSDMAFSRYHSVSQEAPNKETLKQIYNLQQEIREKDRKIKQIKDTIKNSRSSINFAKQELSDYLNGLNEQVKEHEENKHQEKLQKEQAILKRISDSKKYQEEQETEKRREMERVMNYKSVLETQKNLRRDLEYSQSQVFPALKGTQKDMYSDKKYQTLEIPSNKNDNQLMLSLSSMPEFSQVSYTKKNPKVIKRNPITGE